MTHRRTFLKTLAAGSTVALTGIGLSELLRSSKALAAPPLSGAPVVHDFSVEAVLNTRLSYHSVGDAQLPDEVLANVLWAAGKAPMVGSTRRIFAATAEGVFEYDPATHSVSLHQEGNQMSEPDIAFELAVAGDSALDAGAALQYAHLASVAFWTSQSDQVACCTKGSAVGTARSSWNIGDEVQMANCYGRVSEVTGILTELVATPSDGSLPEPVTDGEVSFETALESLHEATEFADTPLSAEILGQILWASYGCTPHRATRGSNPAGLTVGSAGARYYLTERVYLVTSEGVYRYHNHLPDADLSSRDHRLEQMSTDDLRAALCAAEPSLPQGAPAYIVWGSWEASNSSEVEAGFAGSSALLQASSLGLAGYLVAASAQEAIRNSLSLPSDDVPLILMAVGNVATSGTGGAGGTSSTTGGGGGTTSAGGSSATGGTSSSAGGSSATGGTSSTAGGSSATGGTSSSAGGSSATGGTSSSAGGNSAAGGATATQSGGTGTGVGEGVATGGVGTRPGGPAATGGSNSAMADTGARAGASAPGASPDTSSESGCGCRTADTSGGSGSATAAGVAALVGLALARRHEKRSDQS
jgi:MYXO-CTERM domain-containing protein